MSDPAEAGSPAPEAASPAASTPSPAAPASASPSSDAAAGAVLPPSGRPPLTDVPLRVWLLWTALYLALFIGLTWPLARTPADCIVANHGDAFHDMQLFWYMRNGDLLKPEVKTLFFPWGVPLGAQKGFWLVPAMSVPLQWVMPLPLAYNVLCALFFMASGLATAGLARYVGASLPGAFLGGAMLLLSPSYLAEMTGGIPENMALQWLVLYLWAGLRLGVDRRARVSLMAGLFLILTWQTSWYLGAFAVMSSVILPWRRIFPVLVVTGLILFIPIAATVRSGVTENETYDAQIAAQLLSGAIQIPADMDAQRRMDKNVAPTMRVLRESVDPSHMMRRYRPTKMRDVLPGLLAVGLALLGLWNAPRRLWPWAALLALFGFLSLGPHLVVQGFDVMRLPTEWLYVHVSMYSRMRPIRWMLAAMVPLAVLGAFSVPRLRLRGASAAVVGLLIGLQLLEMFVVQVAHYQVALASTRVPAYYRRLAAEPLDQGIIELPLAPYSLQVGQQLYYQTVHRHPMMNYDFVSIMSERELESKAQQNSVIRLITGGGTPVRRRDAEALAAMGLRTILMHTEVTPPLNAPYDTFTFPGKLYDRLCRIYGRPVDEGDGILRFDMSHIRGDVWDADGVLVDDDAPRLELTDFFRPRMPQEAPAREATWTLGTAGGQDDTRWDELRSWVYGDIDAIEVRQGSDLLARVEHHGEHWDWMRIPLRLPDGQPPRLRVPIQVSLGLSGTPREDWQLDRIRLMHVELCSAPKGDRPAPAPSPSTTTAP